MGVIKLDGWTSLTSLVVYDIGLLTLLAPATGTLNTGDVSRVMGRLESACSSPGCNPWSKRAQLFWRGKEHMRLVTIPKKLRTEKEFPAPFGSSSQFPVDFRLTQ